MEAGNDYAVGAWVGAEWYYFYSREAGRQPSFGELLGGLREEADEPPEQFEGEAEEFYYYMELTTEDADADDDGAIGNEWGGEDCDDNNPDVTAPTEEVPYDGIDQDCDGADLTDVDGDGEPSSDAGGADCDDQDPTVLPSGAETCGDEIDQDCDGEDLACDGEKSPDGEDLGVQLDGGCDGCNSGGPPAFSLGLGLGALLFRRRRRS